MNVSDTQIGGKELSGLVRCDCGTANVFDVGPGMMVAVAVCSCGELVTWFHPHFVLSDFARSLCELVNGCEHDV